MATKTITITDDAYNSLASFKEKYESFSDVVKKLTKRNSILNLAGLLSKESASELRKHVAKLRESSENRLDKVADILK